MSPELWAIIAAAVAIIGQGYANGRSAASERAAIRTDLHALGERVARLEGAFAYLRPTPPAPESRQARAA